MQKDTKGILGGAFISIAHVTMSPDLAIAKVYVSMMLEKDKEATLEKLDSRKWEIRKMLGQRIGKQVRIIPDLIFYIDEVEENAARIEELINSLNIPPADDDAE